MSAGKPWPPQELEHLGRCPVCGDARRTLAHAGLQDRLFHCCADGWNLQACQACGTHYLDPRPSARSIGRAYASYLTHAPAARAGRGGGLTGMLRALANGYRNARWGTQLAPQHPLGGFLVPCIPLLRGALEQQFRHLPARPVRPGARLLDVGCGNGDFLQLARAAGWEVEGMDFDAAAVAAARAAGLEVRQGGLELLQAVPDACFDRVTLSHVLEHVHDPVAWLRELHRVLRPGGTLWLQTPNVASLGHARYSAHWRGLEPPRHLTLWNLPTLTRTLRQAGFSRLRPLHTPLLAAMEVHAGSDALRRGLDHAAFMALPLSQRRHPRYLAPALRQRWSLARAEFHTLLASR